MTDTLLSVKEACETLHVTRSTLYREMGAGRLEWIAVGGRRKIRDSELNRYLRERTRRVAA